MIQSLKVMRGGLVDLKARRDIRVSVSRENNDIFDIWKTLKSKKYMVSDFVCVATREKFQRDVDIVIKKKVLSSPQQKPEKLITIPPSKVIEARKREIDEQHEIKRKRDLETRIRTLEETKANGNENMIAKAEIMIKKLKEELATINN